MRPVDVLVVGGGPVGLAASLYAVRHGLTVHVLEPRPAPWDKACGEGVMPGGLAALVDLGVDPDGHVITGIRYLGPGSQATAHFRSGPGRGIRRTTLHAAIARAAAMQGVEVSQLSATGLTQHADRVVVETSGPRGSAGPPLVARHVVAADGLHSWTRRTLGLDRPASGTRRFGQRQHFAVKPWTDHVEVHWGRRAEAYVTPVAPGTVGVAVLSTSRRPFDAHLDDFPRLRERLAGAIPSSDVQGAGPLRQRSSSRVAGRVLLVGDASGYVDAITGEGISLGLAHGRAAAEAITTGRPQAYERAWVHATWRYSVLTHLLRQSTRPAWARAAIVPAAARVPAVFSAAVNELGRVS